MKGKKVLVTGGSGFIGHRLVHRLLAEGASVAISVRYGNVMKNERLRAVWDRITIIEADLRNRGALDSIRDFGPDIVFHLAAYNHVGESFRQVEECFDVNAKGTANLLDQCESAQRIVYISTSEVYGLQESVPFVETMTPNPMSPYSITKYAGELYCRMKQYMGDNRIIVLRPFNAFGPYQSAKAIIPELIINCLKGRPVRTTSGKQTREFNFVENIVDAFILAADHSTAISGPVNIAGGEEIAIRDLVKLIAELTQTTSSVEIGALEHRPNEIWRMYADSARARSVLNWKPRVTLRQGMEQTVAWFREYLQRQAQETVS